MPIQACSKDGKPGYKYGASGTCYTYTPGDRESRKRALEKAEKQAAAIKVSQNERH
jgi:hypothetical protein